MTGEKLGTGLAVCRTEERFQGAAHFGQNPQVVNEVTRRDDLEDLIGMSGRGRAPSPRRCSVTVSAAY